MGWIWLIIIYFILYWAYWHLPIALGILAAGLVIYLIRKVIAANRVKRLMDEHQRQREEEELERQRKQELARINNHKNQQRQFYTSLIDLGSDSFALFESMPNHLLTAEELLDKAEGDFEEGAFAPFWDSVERAAMKLGQFDDSVRTITTNAERHADVAKRYEGPPPAFPIVLDSVTGMAAANTTNDRMRTILRQAQRNFQFATIFEQRKTNQLLVAGFTNLAEALDGMGRRIESSIDGLGEQISEMSSTLDTSLQNLASDLSSTLTTLHESSTEAFSNHFEGLQTSLQKDSESRAARHKQTLDMLDNIQRRKLPRSLGI
jgi:biopolymer transport protein ExbB/TolQ